MKNTENDLSSMGEKRAKVTEIFILTLGSLLKHAEELRRETMVEGREEGRGVEKGDEVRREL